MASSKKVRFIALYLPQFHPIKENDEVWGKGFTEWTNVAKAKPLFRGHYQPHVPADLGFYDLRLEESRIAQAELAKEYGIEGFCYWHYWFGNGEKILEMPIQEVIKSGKPDYPFCLAWANHSWTTATWSNDKKKVVVIRDQKYLGSEDYKLFFYDTLPAFKDKRYITVDGKPLFVIHHPAGIPDLDVFIKTWRELAEKEGLKGLYIVGSSTGIRYSKVVNGKKKHQLPKLSETKQIYDELMAQGLDAINSQNFDRSVLEIQGGIWNFITKYISLHSPIKLLNKFKQESINNHILTEYDSLENVHPSIYSNWDRSPRAGKGATIITDSTPEEFYNILSKTAEVIKNKEDEHRLIFIRSWNEWGEGNYIEPDLKYGRGYLEAIKRVLQNFKK